MTTLGWIALGVAALLVLPRVAEFVALLALRDLRFAQPTAPRHVAPADVPEPIAQVLALPGAALDQLGFSLVHAVASAPAQCVAWPVPRYAVRWRHATGSAWAEVTLAEQPEYGSLVSVGFLTRYTDGTWLLTTRRRGHELIGLHAAVDLLDLDDGDLADQWAAHCARVATHRERSIADGLLAPGDEGRVAAELRTQLCATGLLAAGHDGTARFTWRGALRVLRTYLDAQRRLARLPPLADVGIDPADPRAPALRAHADEVAMREDLAARQARPPTGRGRLLLTTLVVATLLLAWQYDWTFAITLVVALLLHEGGHLWQMRRTGYRDLRVFFIPLIGAAASGHAGNATAWQRCLVLLAGPVPGLALGCAGWLALASGHVQPEAWHYFLVANLVAVNAFNLLPVVPLDGGRYLELLLFARYPRLRAAFVATGGASLIAGALWLDAPLVALLGAMLLLVVPQQLRHTRLEQHLREAMRGAQDAQPLPWLPVLARHLATPRYARLRAPQRVAVARQIEAHGLPAPPPFRTVAGGLALYIIALALPLAAVAVQYLRAHSLP